MNPQDIILIKAKMKALGIKRDTLAKKIHVSASRVNEVLDGKKTNAEVERRLLVWLQRRS